MDDPVKAIEQLGHYTFYCLVTGHGMLASAGTSTLPQQNFF